VVLTPAGVVCVRRLLSEAATRPPRRRFADASALELLLGTDGDDFPAVYGEVMAWRLPANPSRPPPRWPTRCGTRRPGADQSGPGHHGRDRCGRGRTVRPSVGVGTRSSGFALCWLVDEAWPTRVSCSIRPTCTVRRHPRSTHGHRGTGQFGCHPGAGRDHGHQVEVINQMWNAPSPSPPGPDGISEVHSVRWCRSRPQGAVQAAQLVAAPVSVPCPNARRSTADPVSEGNHRAVTRSSGVSNRDPPHDPTHWSAVILRSISPRGLKFRQMACLDQFSFACDPSWVLGLAWLNRSLQPVWRRYRILRIRGG